LENFFLLYANDWFKHKDKISCLSYQFNDAIDLDIKGVEFHDLEDEVVK